MAKGISGGDWFLAGPQIYLGKNFLYCQGFQLPCPLLISLTYKGGPGILTRLVPYPIAYIIRFFLKSALLSPLMQVHQWQRL